MLWLWPYVLWMYLKFDLLPFLSAIRGLRIFPISFKFNLFNLMSSWVLRKYYRPYVLSLQCSLCLMWYSSHQLFTLFSRYTRWGIFASQLLYVLVPNRIFLKLHSSHLRFMQSIMLIMWHQFHLLPIMHTRFSLFIQFFLPLNLPRWILP